MTTFLKTILAVIIGTLATAGIIFAIMIGITYFETQKMMKQIANTGYNYNAPSTGTTPPECVNNPKDVMCQLALAKQKVQELQDANK